MEEQELTRVVEKFSATVFRAAYCCLKNRQDADDVMQDTFLAFYTGGKRFADDEHIKAWLIRVAVNKSRNILRSGRRRFSEPLELAGEIPCEDRHSEGLLPQLMKLEQKYRLVLYLFYFEDMSVKDIAAGTGEKPTTITTRLSRARKLLRDILIKEGYDEY